MRGLPAAMSEGAQCAQAAGMARSVDAEIAIETALSPAFATAFFLLNYVLLDTTSETV
jgi:hypothetical protein